MNPVIDNRQSTIDNPRAAVFLDRDGTIIEEIAYLSDPKNVRLLPGAADFIHRMSAAGYRVVVVSNQSGVARGLISEERLHEIHGRMEVLLAAEAAHVDAAYYCPYLDGPDAVVEKYRKDSDWRKPGPGMLLQAAKELNLDFARSWMVGDSQCDMDAGRRAGCRTILLHRDGGAAIAAQTATHVVCTLAQAAAIVLSEPLPKCNPGAPGGPRGQGDGSRSSTKDA